MIIFYELRLFQYIHISILAWATIAGAFLSFLLGSVTIFFAKNIFHIKSSNLFKHNDVSLIIFNDGGKAIKNAIIFFSTIGLLAALYNWYILFQMFGDLQSIFLNGITIYRLRVSGELPGFIPYLFSFSFVGVIFSGIYSGFKNKISLLSFFPLIAVLLNQIANFSRAGMLFAFFLFITSYMLYRHLVSSNNKLKKTKMLKMTMVIIIILSFLIGSAGLVRTTRGTIESFTGENRELETFKTGFFITPSLYLYISSHIGVLSKYLDDHFDDAPHFGEVTFQPIYNFLAKFGVTNKRSYYDKGYHIPMWTNTSTYIRYLHNDFGIAGIFVFPYLLGLIISILWYGFYEKKKTIYLIIMSYLFVIVMFSFLTIYSRQGGWTISFVISILSTPLIEKFASKSQPPKVLSNT